MPNLLNVEKSVTGKTVNRKSSGFQYGYIQDTFRCQTIFEKMKEKCNFIRIVSA